MLTNILGQGHKELPDETETKKVIAGHGHNVAIMFGKALLAADSIVDEEMARCEAQMKLLSGLRKHIKNAIKENGTTGTIKQLEDKAASVASNGSGNFKLTFVAGGSKFYFSTVILRPT